MVGIAEKVLMNEFKQLSKENWVNVEVCTGRMHDPGTDQI